MISFYFVKKSGNFSIHPPEMDSLLRKHFNQPENPNEWYLNWMEHFWNRIFNEGVHMFPPELRHILAFLNEEEYSVKKIVRPMW